MQFFNLLVLLIVNPANLALAGESVSVAFDKNYDNRDLPLTQVACSAILNGNWSVLSQVPGFPNVAGSMLSTWKSAQCGKCYKIYWERTGNTVYVTAVDYADIGFVLSQTTMDALTNNNAENIGRLDASYQLVQSYRCVPSALGRRSSVAV